MWAVQLVLWSLVFIALSFIGLAVIRLAFGKLEKIDYLIAKIVGLVVFFALFWLIGYLKLPILSPLVLNSVLLLLATVSIWYLRREKEKFRFEAFFLSEELYLILMLAFVAVRGFYPTVTDGEKPMEMMMLSSVMRARSLPPEDAWFAGGTLNYYYFGYFVFGSVAKMIGASSFIAFNFGLASIWSLTLIGLSYLGYQLTRKWPAAILAPVLYALIGNLDTIDQLLHRASDTAFDWWRASRVLPGTINEFPAFSYLFGDFHPHMIVSVWLVALIIALFKVFGLKPSIYHALLIGLILGQIFVVSSWSALTAILTLATYFVLRPPPIKLIILGALSALAIIVPYQLQLQQSVWQGIALVKEQDRSAIDLWLRHWGILLLGAIAFLVSYLNKKEHKFNLIILFVPIVLIALSEIIFIKDAYGYRLNTVFKFYYDSWLMLSIVAAVGFGWMVSKNLVSFIIVAIALGAGALYLPLALPERFDHFQKWYGGDPAVLTFIKHPLLKEPYNQLKKAPLGSRLFEKSGDSFTDANLLSAFTGVPTLLGWYGHENLWRAGTVEVGQRRTISDQTNDCQIDPLIQGEFRFNYCYLGDGKLIKIQ